VHPESYFFRKMTFPYRRVSYGPTIKKQSVGKEKMNDSIRYFVHQEQPV
jgi:hypothetical protein